ncbi:DUF6906 family protein [Enterococcus sp. LJL51]|uniref:DUF6906 family protein n=1 Tax=Enterococcus sp. LJL51 TaxID=3416656 RepID=UPI003CF36C07
MARDRRPTRRMKERIAREKIGNQYLNPSKWLVRNLSNGRMIIVHKKSKKEKELVYEGI